jgi:farnesyl-diphosphate farnesyltransferase
MSANDNAITPPPPAPSPNVESWSGKSRSDENFPVGSWLIRAPLRPHVHAFYNFARNADDIADSPDLTPAEKITRLNTMEAVLTGTISDASPSATALRASLAASAVPAIHARELLIAFRRDATQTRYENWAALMDYCRYSAAPVGRYVLDLHGESHATWPASDALCAALQILNHLQDCAADLRALDRCYIPQDMLARHGAVTDDIARGKTNLPLRAVFDEMLTLTEDLNKSAAALPRLVKARRLRAETAIIARLACRLTARLRVGDPLATRVKLQKSDFAAATIAALPSLA